ncbi:hypothetical protein [Lactiplantibacillus plantarum]|uniref:Prophage P2a protein 28 n=1 Tax=Lactiplantibacillus plantarum (strain ATCC BAA-793 / NCIMB 8826 / WCFS1) TaxID=220668 RepID=F9UQW9_LACPL|nr:hypothetical protein [Lactiplantibacillus plantarum]MDE4415960.1 hypothetical protein [Lactiplantibacillus plantarum]MDE4416494.1 hypothetical protein [Lactiplantibacillus plantarum]MDE4421738.1 hypothetical protein [Lactiplantibacillus plantarum]MDE4423072.1 hypothetical protein [Lactiplantibacillus plantarum]MDE4428720.1 hypothetical protein [Lactiplantibacillus plantarum]
MKQIFEVIWNATPWQLVSWIGSIVLGVVIAFGLILLFLSMYHR